MVGDEDERPLFREGRQPFRVIVELQAQEAQTRLKKGLALHRCGAVFQIEIHEVALPHEMFDQPDGGSLEHTVARRHETELLFQAGWRQTFWIVCHEKSLVCPG